MHLNLYKVLTMKKLLLFSLSVCAIISISSGQTDGPIQITAERLQKIKTEVDKEVAVFKQTLSKKDYSADEIEFATDTFKIEHIASKRIEVDYSTTGMNETITLLTGEYDKLLNKYYNKLIKLLNPADRKVLIAAQKSWILFKEAEQKVIGVLTKEEYSGGGTIQTNIEADLISQLTVKRTIEIFNHYNAILKNK